MGGAGLDVSGLLAVAALIGIVGLLLRGVFSATGKKKPIRRSLNAEWTDDRDHVRSGHSTDGTDGGPDGGTSND